MSTGNLHRRVPAGVVGGPPAGTGGRSGGAPDEAVRRADAGRAGNRLGAGSVHPAAARTQSDGPARGAEQFAALQKQHPGA